jgi:hypothetical protein
MHIIFVFSTSEGKTKSFRVPNVLSSPKAIDVKDAAKAFVSSNIFAPKAGTLTAPKKATLVDVIEKQFVVGAAEY